jgi:hypothetical protein
MITSEDESTDLSWAWRTAIDNDESHTRSVAAWMSIAGEISKSPDLVETLLRESVGRSSLKPPMESHGCAHCARCSS